MVRLITSTLGVLGLVLLTSCNQEEYYQKEYLTPYNGVNIHVVKTPIPTTNGNPTFPNSGSGTTSNPSKPSDPSTTPSPTPSATVIPDPTVTATPVATVTPDPTATATPVPNQKLVIEQFTQNSLTSGRVDILWVIDNSGSMRDNQDNLARNFDVFINDFIVKNIDFKMGVTTTDATSLFNGRQICGEDKLSLTQAQANPTQFIYDFQTCVRVGNQGSSLEKGLHTMNEYFKKYASTFIRPDAYLVVIILTDENDQSSLTVQAYADALKTYKSNAGLIKYYGLVTTVLPVSRSVESIGTRYMQMRDILGGTIADITSDFYQTLTDFGGSIVNLMSSFALSQNPVSNVVVKVNGLQVMTGWTYDTQNRSVKFDDQSIPPEGATITIEYYVEQT